MVASKFQLPFVKKERLSNEVYSFHFDRNAHNFNFFAGQYFRMTLPIDNPDERGSSRYFTVSSSPNEKFLTITTKIIKSTFKLKFSSLAPGDKATFFGPFGDIIQDNIDFMPKIMIAGGIGITPAHSMLRFIDEERLDVNFTLLASFSDEEDAIFFKEIKDIESRNSKVSVVYTLSKEKGNSDYEGGRIDEKFIKKYAPNVSNARIFLGGPLNMVEKFQNILGEIGVQEENIIAEDFTGY